MDRKLQPSSPAFHLLFILVLFYLCSAPSYQQVCNHRDQSALLTFSSDVSISSYPPLNWSHAVSCCQWEGIYCDVNGSVTRLQLSFRGLEGVITSSIGDLTSLTHLNLSNNDLRGSLIEGIVRLINLRIMDLSSNSFSGPIPEHIGNLVYLEKLYLPYNNFSGSIPTSLMKLTNLVDLILRDNHLDGDISKLDFSRIVHLQKLDLRNNSFRGVLPKSIYSCKSLIAVRVSLNNLSGQISPDIVQLKSLSFLSLTANYFTNITGMFTILTNCKNLTSLFLGDNFYGESLPSHKNFIGSAGFPNLEYLSMDGCCITGLFPEWLSNLKRVRLLSLNHNRFRGKIPNSMGTLPNLFSLSLSSNLLFGEIPKELCQLPALVSESVDPKLNHFQFELPMFRHVFSRTYYQYTTLPSVLNFSDNRLSGHIPSEIGKLKSLQQLVLGGNHFSGSIPVALSDLENLELLDLSENDLTGGIPTSLGSLHFLSYLDVSYNDLRGPVPTGGQFDTFDESSFEGNPGLCGGHFYRPCYEKVKPGAKDSRRDFQVFLQL